MPIYAYKAKDLEGKYFEGLLEATDEEALIASLHRQGKVILSITHEQKALLGKRTAGRTFSTAVFKPKVKSSDIVLFVTQLSTLIDAGLPLLRALNVLIHETENPTLRQILSDVSLRVEGGRSLSESLAMHPVFTNIFISMVRAGEMSGQLHMTLEQLAIYLDHLEEIKGKIRSAITYPSFLVVFSLIVLSILILKVVPIFEGVYAKYRAKLPAPTQFIMQVSDIFRENLLPILVGGAIIIGLTIVFLGTDKGKAIKDRVLIKIPLLGIVIYKTILSRFARTLGILVGSGIPFIEAMRLVALASNNKVIESALNRSASDIEGGSTIAEALEKTGLFPRMLTSLISSGEEVGALEKMLAKAAGFYDRQVDAGISGLMALLEPVLIVFLGGIVGLILLAMYLPVFTLGRAISAGGG
jgi:type IV pilus assembly protein PilC